jgi:hypothetical protein
MTLRVTEGETDEAEHERPLCDGCFG